ncbi:DUF4181 domain-containing protein [Bacillus sp. AFS015802]|uniref:DUF4181 domain-containing protein n=1 Tax=Bacillus sp. AFS015802 TaxID=2033486 RepID=UPI0015CF4357|nr:DUF4181 domain-containing protein [Bacillus sp. AFS015802]
MDAFWIKAFLFLAIYGLLIFLFNAGMRKVLNVKRKKVFSYHHLSEKHKKIDWTIRIIAAIFIIVGGFYNTFTLGPERKVWYLESYVLLFAFVSVSESVRAAFEKRLSDNPNDYKFTLSQLAFLTVTLLLFYTTEFFGIFT